jgi:hypothetical protein
MVALATVWCATLFRHPLAWSPDEDWEYFEAWLEIARRTILQFHDWPLWNPYTCGGQAYLAHPQNIVASPQFLLVLAVGTALGAKLILVSLHVLALDGSHRLARSLGLSEAAAWCAAIVYAGCGWITLQNAAGHLPSAGAAVMPYLVLWFTRALDAEDNQAVVRAVVGMGLVAAWILALGGTATPSIAVVLVVVLALWAVVARRSPRALIVLGAAAIVCLLVGAVRMLPVLEGMMEHPRGMPESDSASPLYLLSNAWRAPTVNLREGTQYRFYEYAWRVPLLALPLALVGCVRKRAWPYVALALVGVAIAIGDWWPHGPWWLLRHVPVFSDLRVPSRYLLVVAFAVAMLAAMGVDELEALVARRSRAAAHAVIVVLVALMAADAGQYVRQQYRALFTTMPIGRERWPSVVQVKGRAGDMLSYVLNGQGVLHCWEDGPSPRAFELDEGNVAQARIDGDAAGTVAIESWQPSTMKLRVHLATPARVLVNQNWAPHWRASVGRVVPFPPVTGRLGTVGRIAIELPAGEHEVTLAYRPSSFYIGAAITALTTMVLIGLWLARRVRFCVLRQKST